MPKKRLNIEFEIDNTHLELIEDIAKEYKISSNSKAIRILLDYVAKDADSFQIFSKENMRCRFC
ncbi:MAG: hypothetical protein MK330_04145 [SAR202 cluster bacterium]|nr:hypothetical protein [SAR202 cluster bacterium]